MKAQALFLALLWLALAVVFLVGCSSLPWCKSADKWTDRLDAAEVQLLTAKADADSALAAGMISQATHDEVDKYADAGLDAVAAGRTMVNLCVLGKGQASDLEGKIESAESAALGAPKFLAINSRTVR